MEKNITPEKVFKVEDKGIKTFEEIETAINLCKDTIAKEKNITPEDVTLKNLHEFLQKKAKLSKIIPQN